MRAPSIGARSDIHIGCNGSQLPPCLRTRWHCVPSSEERYRPDTVVRVMQTRPDDGAVRSGPLQVLSFSTFLPWGRSPAPVFENRSRPLLVFRQRTVSLSLSLLFWIGWPRSSSFRQTICKPRPCSSNFSIHACAFWSAYPQNLSF